MRILLRKRRLLRNVPISQVGQNAAGSFELPASAFGLTRVGAFALPRQQHTPAPFFFYGAGPVPPAELAALTQANLTQGANGATTAQWTGAAASNEYLYYAYPVDLKEPVFTYQGFQGGFYLVGYRNLPRTVAGKPVLSVFALWQSATPNLGQHVELTATHA